MFRRFIAWLMDRPLEAPAPWPEDIWLRAIALSEQAVLLTHRSLTAQHFDVVVEVYSESIDELFTRLEWIVASIEYQTDVPTAWKDRRRVVVPITIVDYYFDTIHGYRAPQTVVEVLAEKIAVIHHLLESEGIDDQHHFYHYIRREFHSVMQDTVEILEVSIGLAKPK